MEEADNELIKKLNENRTKKQELQGKSVDIVQRLLEIRNLEATNARSLQQFNKNFTESIFPSREQDDKRERFKRYCKIRYYRTTIKQ